MTFKRAQSDRVRRRPFRAASAIVASCVMAVSGSVTAAEAPAEANAEGVAYFETHIRPVLVSKCYACHSASVQAKGGLRLDTREGVRLGGQSGTALVPGQPTESLLIEALKYEGLQMPPKEKLPDEVIAHFEEWIRLGAPDPRDRETTPIAGQRNIDFAKEREHWSYQPLQKVTPPEVKDAKWAFTEIDRFIQSKLEAAGLQAAADTDKSTWLRRVTFDLTGLPATPGELLDFELDQSPRAREKVVDRLLASPQFGERWGRHWLDVARFGESTGKERNFVYLQAWRYRNYVVDAFNEDKPYDQFLREQIAGDLLPHANDRERDTHHIATGFLALNPKGINDRNRESFLLEIVDEQIESVGRGVLGISIGCARCHDHKYDAIPSTDYYAIAGIFRSSEPKFGMLNRQRYTNEPEHLIALAAAENRLGPTLTDEQLARVKADQKHFQQLQQQVRQLRNAVAAPPVPTVAEAAAATAAESATTPAPAQGSDATATSTSTANPGLDAVATAAVPAPPVDLAKQLADKEKELREFVEQQDKLRNEVAVATANNTLIGVIERSEPADIAVRVRGEVDKLGPVVPRGLLTVLKTESTPSIDGRQSGRKELSQWLTSPENPLVARVYVNRVWSKLLGAGIVSTVDDFGVQGQAPTHPELLDYLAGSFINQGWSTKKLIRSIVLSHVYGTGDLADPKNETVDGENKLLWRWNRRRLEAEAIRDSILAISGDLDLSRPQGTLLTELGTRELGPQANFAPVQRHNPVRSVYLPQLRGQIPEILALFDMADPSLTVGKRDATSGPDQALYLLNSPILLEQSQKFAQRLLSARVQDDGARIDLAFRLTLGRAPTTSQRERALQFVRELEESAKVAPAVAATEAASAATTPDGATATEVAAKADPRLKAWSRLTQSLFALPEFRYVF